MAKQDPVLVDVANLEHQPEGRAPGLGWTPIHRSVPGATWLPGAGTGKKASGFADAFAKRIEAATGGDKSRPIVTFCHPQRWGSWNAAKRLTELHYTHVYWYPGGSEGWAAQGRFETRRRGPAVAGSRLRQEQRGGHAGFRVEGRAIAARQRPRAMTGSAA